MNAKKSFLTEVTQPDAGKPNPVKKELEDTLLLIEWSEVSKVYFNESHSFLFHKMDGKDSKGNPVPFTPDEIEVLRGALCDIADKLRVHADNLAKLNVE